VDFVEDTDDFSGYKLVIAPLQYLMTPELEQKYFDYVAGGGHLLLTMRTGVKDEHNLCMSDRELPGRLGDLCGIEILDYDCLRDVDVQVRMNESEETLLGAKWADIITCKGAKTVADYANEFYAGTPCITENVYGDGKAYYVGTEPKEELMKRILAFITEEVGVKNLGWSDEEVELSVREKDGKKWLFAINFGLEEGCYQVPKEYKLILGSEAGVLKPFEIHLYVNE